MRLALALAAVAALVVPASAAADATVTSTPGDGMVWTGTGVDETVEIKLAGSRFELRSSRPMQPGTGCVQVGATGIRATCTAFKLRNGGGFRPFRVDTLGGQDVVRNETAVPMVASGGPGLGDNLRGGPGADTLDGGEGDFDTLDGGGGPDVLDGGPGVSDRVNYGSRTAMVLADFEGDADDGEGDEGDRILATVEDVFGGSGPDVLEGDGRSNLLLGGGGHDRLFGRGGADGLSGGDGDDILVDNGLPSPGGDDGFVDRLWGGGGVDFCVAGAQDVKEECEL